ncbi:SAM-dependent methyltransferase [Planobispora takensis]|uniref:S-adenosyl methyltransferase n=1 Tax=Planobispora takensis TaxID=1367882 RepID=A0A8J3T234_9ACTN|nr:SAM-dependent methyltransferase [Planobispora takensis]GII04682.1 hypothetical protein Pta02_66900 [Planobispora takensis]
MTELPRVPTGVDPTVPSSARVHNYLLGGKDHFEADRALATRLLKAAPDSAALARAGRRFLAGAVRHMAREGTEQFLDLGTGIPAPPSVHEVAREIRPGARVAYVDYDPVVAMHNEVMFAGEEGVVSVRGDARDPQAVLQDPRITGLLDFSRPVGLLLVGVLHFVTEEEDPAGIVRAFRDRMVPGSHLALSHGMADSDPEAVAQLQAGAEGTPTQSVLRTHERVLALFEGFDLAEPGLVPVQRWRPEFDDPVRGLRIEGGVGVLRPA